MKTETDEQRQKWKYKPGYVITKEKLKEIGNFKLQPIF